MIRRHPVSSFAAALVALAVLAACGGGSSPSSSSPDEGIVVRGSSSGNASALSGASSAAVITVWVKDQPSIKTTVAADGSFTLRGLPPGDFTLVFSNERGAVIGELGFDAVAPNQEITITVRITSSGVTLVDERRNGIGHGAAEFEGKVTAVLALVPSGDSRFLIAGYTVVARPGQTAILQGNSRRSVTDVTVGRSVHVKGVWIPSVSSASQAVLAHEIDLQADSTPGSGGSGGGNVQSQCFAQGAKAEIEGIIVAKGASSITVAQQGKGNYLCQVSGGTRIRKGNKSYTFDQLQSGWRVHVSGEGQGTSGGLCQVTAEEVKVQQN
jgi:hypothetical protein